MTRKERERFINRLEQHTQEMLKSCWLMTNGGRVSPRKLGYEYEGFYYRDQHIADMNLYTIMKQHEKLMANE